MSCESIVASVQQHSCGYVVVTGGEPMIDPDIVDLTQALREIDHHITIETAGTVFKTVECDLMSISPKLSNSTPLNDPRDANGAWAARHEARRISIEALQALIDAHPERQLKFVVASPGDLAEIDALLARLRGWTNTDVMLMPEGVTPSQRRPWLVEACISRGWRYCQRLHIELFGNTRGT